MVSFDIIVLSLYVYKVNRFKKLSQNLNDAVYHRINYILNKIIFLTLCYQCTVYFGVIISTVIFPILGIWGYVIWYIAIFIDKTVSTAAIFLMMEHNIRTYNILVQRYLVGCLKLDKICCCCCNGLLSVQLTDEQNIAANIDGMKPKTGSNIETGTSGKTTEMSVDTKTTNSNSIKIITREIEQSEYTKTTI